MSTISPLSISVEESAISDLAGRLAATRWIDDPSAARLYYEMAQSPPDRQHVKVPTAAAIFPKEVVKLPRAWAERHYNIVQWNVFDHGGHFPALEHPDVLVRDLRRFAGVLSV